ncbi:DUF255 domain-containing protein [Curtobacterium sp. MCJR17_043]|uniref:DUF255 domain-containing protein n=1 Tax=Curtobacterium sp. MCJR17_043 TaxID=2175660 RepID=UPI0024E03433|nr:DUF255 domain-containing protein [Curtobacterium sp. MCJR17_043]WIB35589.1 DUF255 domain-containing protein [Curtobacterium sp. MCJR17_043]
MNDNRLGSAVSPYLRQHATNPVDWREWGSRGVRRGARAGRPRPGVDRVRHLPLVPRHGPGELLRPRGRRAAAAGLRRGQGRP